MNHLLAAARLVQRLIKAERVSHVHVDQDSGETLCPSCAAERGVTTQVPLRVGEDANCMADDCEGGFSGYGWSAQGPEHMDYSHMLPQEMRDAGVRLHVSHGPGFAGHAGGTTQDYEHARAWLEGGPRGDGAYRSGWGGYMWKENGHWRVERQHADKHRGSAWPEGGAWHVVNGPTESRKRAALWHRAGYDALKHYLTTAYDDHPLSENFGMHYGEGPPKRQRRR